MKIFEKRVVAILIDGFVFGAIYTLFKELVIPKQFLELGLIFYLILFFPLFCKDLFFRNASLGKKIMGIEIFDCNWKKPKGYILIKRAFLMLTVGYVIAYKSFFVDKDNFRIFDYEREKLGTYVIDKKVFAKLSEEAKEKTGPFEINMNKLYQDYLRSNYLK